MLFARYRSSLIRAIPVALGIGILFGVIITVGGNVPSWRILGPAVLLGIIISVATAISAILASLITLMLTDRELRRSETFRVTTVLFSAGLGPFIVATAIGLIEGVLSGSLLNWFGMWVFLGGAAGVAAAVTGFALVSIDEYNARDRA